MVCRFYLLMFSMLFSRSPAGGIQAVATEEADSLLGNNYTSIAFTPSASSVSAAERRNRNKAVLDITTVPYGRKAPPKHFHLKAMFTKAGNQDYADGKLLQIHPCTEIEAKDFERELIFNWIAVYKLEDPEQGCHPKNIIFRAKLALTKGASAVIFDVRDNKNASKELKRTRNPLGKPVLTIDGKAARKLQALLRDNREATIEIKNLLVHASNKKTSIQENFTSQNESDKADEINSAILLGVAGVVILVAVSAIFILKCRRVNGKLSRRKLVERLLKRMKTSFYDGSADLDESRNDGHSCVVCLVDYVLGQEIRTLPCSHKFHRCCVDPWLLTNRTCPLCVFDITDAKRHMKKKCLSSIQHAPPSVEAPIRQVLQVDDNTETIHSFASFNSHSALTRSSGDVSDGCGMLNVTIAMHEDRSAFTCNFVGGFEYSGIRPSDPPSCSVHQRTCGRYSLLHQAAEDNRCLVEKQFILPHSYDGHCSIHCNSRFPAERLKPLAWNRSSGYDADVSSVETIGSSADPASATDSCPAPALSCTSSVELSNCTNVAEFGSNSSCHSICFVNPSTYDLSPVHLQPSCLADVVSMTLPSECT